MNVIRYESEAAGERLSRDEQIVRTNRLTFPLQIGTNPRSGFRCYAIKREFDDARDESPDLLPLFGRVLSFLHAAEQFVNRTIETAQSVGAS